MLWSIAVMRMFLCGYFDISFQYKIVRKIQEDCELRQCIERRTLG